MIYPKTYLVGMTQPIAAGVKQYLQDTKQTEFLDSIAAALREDIPHAAIMCSMFAKMCYKSLVVGQNANVSKVRDIQSNLENVIETGHGSVLEHVTFNFITTNCSRVFTHELVRHRAGTAFSQTSGRYVALDKIDLVLPPELVQCPQCVGGISGVGENKPCKACNGTGERHINFKYDNGEVIKQSVTMLLYSEIQSIENLATQLREQIIGDSKDFNFKKRITSAIRRIAPNGQTNEIAWLANWRALRHIIEMRTNRAAEWEIRYVFDEVVRLINQVSDIYLYGGVSETVDGLVEYRNLKV